MPSGSGDPLLNQGVRPPEEPPAELRVERRSEPAPGTRAAFAHLARAIARDTGGAARRFRDRLFALRWRKRRDAAPRARLRLRPLHVLAACVAFTAGLGVAVFAWAVHDLPIPSRDEVASPRVITLEASDGQQLARKGPIRLPPVDAKDMPAHLVNAVVSIEDRRFYDHPGVDPMSIGRAFVQNLTAGGIVEGGSTITQQLAKNLFLSPERTFKRKIQEAVLATWLEFRFSKDEILTSYLNRVYLGSGATGFPAAAKVYFGKQVGELSFAESAMLAGLIRAPSLDNPVRNADAARARTATVLDAMVANGKLKQQEADNVKAQPAELHQAQVALPSGGWFADWVSGQATEVANSFRGTIRARTTLDPQLQAAAQRAVTSVLDKEGRTRRAQQAALVAMRPDGAVVAMVGGRNYEDSQFNRAVQALRQPGSTFKLFVYYAALRKGLSPDDVILDAPVEVNGWEPENYSGRYYGRVTLAEAFGRSLNAATVRLSQKIGLDAVIAAARDLGLRAPLGKNASLPLGTSEVSLLDLTSAFAAVRAGATPVEPWGIAGFGTQDQARLFTAGPPGKAQRGIPQQYREALTDLLQGVVQRGTGRAAALDGFAAGKTGTSENYRDAWFVGFNDSLVVGVWVGNDDRSPMNNVTGGMLPAQIWRTFMEAARPNVAESASPPPRTPTTATATSVQADVAAPVGDRGGTCNIAVCEQFYNSFRASDCTYQPYWGGSRRRCER
jgi:penicillin-binding protein 1A